MEHRPGGRVRADLEPALEALCGDAILLRSKHPTRREPHGQRRPAPVEERAGRHGRLLLATGALVAPVGPKPAAAVLAPRAHEPLRPAQPVEVVQAVLVGGEPRLELVGRARIVQPAPGVVGHDGKPTPSSGLR